MGETPGNSTTEDGIFEATVSNISNWGAPTKICCCELLPSPPNFNVDYHRRNATTYDIMSPCASYNIEIGG